MAKYLQQSGIDESTGQPVDVKQAVAQLPDGREGGLVAVGNTVTVKGVGGTTITRNAIPAGTAFSGTSPTVTAGMWIPMDDFAEVLVALDTDATGGNLNIEYSNDGVTASNYKTTKAITSGSGAVISSIEGVVPAAGSSVTELMFKHFPYFRVSLDSGAGTGTTAEVNVTMRK